MSRPGNARRPLDPSPLRSRVGAPPDQGRDRRLDGRRSAPRARPDVRSSPACRRRVRAVVARSPPDGSAAASTAVHSGPLQHRVGGTSGSPGSHPPERGAWPWTHPRPPRTGGGDSVTTSWVVGSPPRVRVTASRRCGSSTPTRDGSIGSPTVEYTVATLDVTGYSSGARRSSRRTGGWGHCSHQRVTGCCTDYRSRDSPTRSRGTVRTSRGYGLASGRTPTAPGSRDRRTVRHRGRPRRPVDLSLDVRIAAVRRWALPCRPGEPLRCIS